MKTRIIRGRSKAPIDFHSEFVKEFEQTFAKTAPVPASSFPSSCCAYCQHVGRDPATEIPYNRLQTTPICKRQHPARSWTLTQCDDFQQFVSLQRRPVTITRDLLANTIIPDGQICMTCDHQNNCQIVPRGWVFQVQNCGARQSNVPVLCHTCAHRANYPCSLPDTTECPTYIPLAEHRYNVRDVFSIYMFESGNWNSTRFYNLVSFLWDVTKKLVTVLPRAIWYYTDRWVYGPIVDPPTGTASLLQDGAPIDANGHRIGSSLLQGGPRYRHPSGHRVRHPLRYNHPLVYGIYCKLTHRDPVTGNRV